MQSPYYVDSLQIMIQLQSQCHNTSSSISEKFTNMQIIYTFEFMFHMDHHLVKHSLEYLLYLLFLIFCLVISLCLKSLSQVFFVNFNYDLVCFILIGSLLAY
jgi:hypothetical protein